ncbi:MAG: hypothetical protein K8U03_15485 [Planctomycetia bacterium]|nr:hypothetical protein [Planctomycetia bacterium]
MIRNSLRYFTALLFGALCVTARPASADDLVLKAHEFPPHGSGTYLAGELVLIDPVNRRAGMRLDGDGGQRYQDGPLHYFAMLPYGMIWFHGAPAELRDLAIGTHVHGYFYLPPTGEEATIPPLPPDQKLYEVKHNHAVTLEDDFSFYQRRGQGWKVAKLDIEKGKIDVEPVGKSAKDGINTPYIFDINDATRVWKQRKLVDLADIVVGRPVQLNLTWSPGSRDKEFTVADIWLDDESARFATELQQRRRTKTSRRRKTKGSASPRPRRRCALGFIVPTRRSAKCWSGKRPRTRRWVAAAFRFA